MLGAEWAAGRLTAGLAVGHSIGEGGYRGENDTGAVESALTGVYPYLGHDLTERVSVWGMAGVGEGTLTLTPEGQDAIETDMDMTMGTAGIRGEVLRPAQVHGLSLAIEADALATRTTSERTTGLASADAGTSRLRPGLKGSRSFDTGDGATLTPSLEVGIRHDGGDAETGTGVDLGGGVAYADPASGLSLDLHARTLVAHEASGFREWGASGSLGYDSDPSSERGLALSLTSGVGAQAQGGADALLGRTTLEGLAATEDVPGGRLDATLGYGLAAFGDRFTGTPWAGLGLTESGRAWRLGWRLTPAGDHAPDLGLSVEAVRSEADAGDTDHSLMLRVESRF